MTSVKNQGGCGSCVAFAAVGTVEAQYKITYRNPLGISICQNSICSLVEADSADTAGTSASH